MAQFQDYFKFPLRMWESMSSKVWTNDNKMAFDWMINVPRETKQKLLDRINGTVNTPYTVKKEYWHDSGIIYCRLLSGEKEGIEFKMLRIRGWGMLTGVGGYNLDNKTAAEIQDAFAEYIVKQLNNYV